EPGTGNSTAGDFELPSFDASEEDLGSEDIFDLDDVDSEPQARSRIEFRYPSKAKRRDIEGVVKIEYIVDENGNVQEVDVIESPDRILSEATVEVIRNTTFEPATKNGRPVKVRMRASVPYE
ncbi:MAG: energy transducer TonB, partial [Opitutales bacterium]